MRPPSLRTVLVASHLLVLVLPLAILLGSGAIAVDLAETRRAEVERHAALVALLLQHDLDDGVATAAHDRRDDLAAAADATKAGIRLVDPAGTVVFSTGPGNGASFADRPEVQAALRGEVATAVRQGAPTPTPASTDPTGELVWLFVAAPLVSDAGAIEGAVLLARRTREDTTWLREVLERTPPGVVVAVGLTLLLALGSAALVARSVGRLAGATRAVAAGAPPSALDDARAAPVAEVRALAADVAAMADRLDGHARRNRDFAGHAAHEFKTPLSTLRGTVAVLLDDADLPTAQRERFLVNAATDLERLQRIVDGLLALARVEERPAAERVELDAVLTSLAERHPDALIEGRAGAVKGDVVALERALENLVDNAFDHGAPPVRVVGWLDGDRTGVDVLDAGPGVPAADRQRVFERFYTTSADRRGTGLGLAIVAAVAAAHGGTARVVPGGLRLELPRLP